MSLEDRLYPLLRLYNRLPHGLKWSLGLVYRQLPASIRKGKNYRAFQELLDAGEKWSPEEIAAFQLKELRKVLIQANAYSPYYQRRFAETRFRPDELKSLADLRHCPFLTKADLLEHREEMVSSAFTKSERLYITTGGSTGVPVGFYLQKGISRPKEQAFLEGIWRRGGYFNGARLAVIRGFVTSSKAEGRISTYDATRDWLILSSYHLLPERMAEYLEALEKFKPDLLYVYPSAVLQIAEFLERSGQSWRLPLRGLLCGSEQLTVPQKQTLERVFKCRVYAWYGHSERVVLAGQGARTDLYYFLPHYGYVEFGPPDEFGRQEVIGTSFHNLAMPLIRYRTGDFVRLAPPGADLEYPWPAATEIAGRAQEFLVSANGRKISLTAINMHDRIFDDLYAVQFYQKERGAAEFRYVPGPKFSSSRLKAIEAGLKEKLGHDFNLQCREVQSVEKSASGKHRWLISELQQEPSAEP